MKPYVKPDIMFEDFQLTQSVAACRWDLMQEDEHVCGAQYDIMLDNSGASGIILFQDNMGVCNVKNSRIQAYCYTYGMLSDKVLNS